MFLVRISFGLVYKPNFVINILKYLKTVNFYIINSVVYMDNIIYEYMDNIVKNK